MSLYKYRISLVEINADFMEISKVTLLLKSEKLLASYFKIAEPINLEFSVSKSNSSNLIFVFV